MQPVRISELIEATQGRAIGVRDVAAGFDRIETDSRKVRRGDVFWALSGSQHDGHAFVAEARSRGASLCVGEAGKLGKPLLPAIAVKDSLAALWSFANWHRRRQEALVIAVTGSVGKTTTRSMLYATLNARFSGIQSPHNFNNHVGVPLTLLGIDPDHEFAVVELGASKVGEIGRLARIAEPEMGILTAIAPAHLDEFGTIEDICRTKGELLEALPENGIAVLNGDDERVRSLAQRAGCRVLFAGSRVNNDIVARGIETEGEYLRFQVDRSKFVVQAAGRHFLTSAVLSVAVGREIGMHDAEIAAGLQSFRPVAGRCQVLTIGPWTVIDDTYNASPASMHAACELLRDWRGGNQRVLISGDMLALGAGSDEFHKFLGTDAARIGIHRLIAVGAQAANVARSARDSGMDAGCLGACRDLDTLSVLLDCWLEPGDVVLVKGSRGMHMEHVIARLKDLAAARKQEAKLRKAA